MDLPPLAKSIDSKYIGFPFSDKGDFTFKQASLTGAKASRVDPFFDPFGVDVDLIEVLEDADIVDVVIVIVVPKPLDLF